MQASVWSGISDSLVNRSIEHTVTMKPIDVAIQTDTSVWNMRRGPLPSLQTPEMLVEQLEEALDKRDYHIECLKKMSLHLKQRPALKNGRLDLNSDRVTEFYRYITKCRTLTIEVCDLVSAWQAACWRTDKGQEALADLLSEQDGISTRLASMIKDMDFLSEIEVLKTQLAAPPLEAKPPAGNRLSPERPYNRNKTKSGLRPENTAPLPMIKSQKSIPEMRGQPFTSPPRTRSTTLSIDVPGAEPSSPKTADGTTSPIDPLLASMTLSGMPLGSWVFRARPASKFPTLDPDESRRMLRMLAALSESRVLLQAAQRQEEELRVAFEKKQKELEEANAEGFDTQKVNDSKQKEAELVKAVEKAKRESVALKAKAEAETLVSRTLPDLEVEANQMKQKAKNLTGVHSEVDNLRTRCDEVAGEMAKVRAKDAAVHASISETEGRILEIKKAIAELS